MIQDVINCFSLIYVARLSEAINGVAFFGVRILMNGIKLIHLLPFSLFHSFSSLVSYIRSLQPGCDEAGSDHVERTVMMKSQQFDSRKLSLTCRRIIIVNNPAEIIKCYSNHRRRYTSVLVK